MKKQIAAIVLASLLMQSGICSAEELSFRERIESILGTNPFSEYYKPYNADKPEYNEPDNGKETAAEETEASDGSNSDILKESAELRAELEKAVRKRHDATDNTTSAAKAATHATDYSKPQTALSGPQKVEVIEERSLDAELPNHINESSDCTYHDYRSGEVYNIGTLNGYLTDITLESGETLERITLGDNQRWDIDTYQDTVEGTWHIYVQPSQLDISTNMIICTDRRNYQVLLDANGLYDPIVAWRYKSSPVQHAKTVRNITVDSADKLNFRYKADREADQGPQYIFDDGRNTYLVFDPDTIASISPAVFTTEKYSGNLTLIDYEKSGSNLIINGKYDNLKLIINNRCINITAV